jgi:hypothetical protein
MLRIDTGLYAIRVQVYNCVLQKDSLLIYISTQLEVDGKVITQKLQIE